jgi:hypothetical protein
VPQQLQQLHQLQQFPQLHQLQQFPLRDIRGPLSTAPEEWLPTGRRYTFPDEGALTRGGAGLIVFDTMIPPPGSLVGLEGAVVLITVRKTPGTRTTGSGRKRAMRNDNQRIFREQEPPALALGRRRGDAAMFYIYRHYTQSSVLRNTETAPTHQSVSYLNAFPRCDPSMPGRPYCCRFQGESPEVIAFPGSEPF